MNIKRPTRNMATTVSRGVSGTGTHAYVSYSNDELSSGVNQSFRQPVLLSASLTLICPIIAYSSGQSKLRAYNDLLVSLLLDRGARWI
jgi:hypothetical protein